MTEILPVSSAGFLLIFVFTVAGAIIQGSIGFGLNLVVVPIAALVEPACVPASLIIMSIPMTAGSASLERRHIDREGVLWLTIGRLPGVVIGVYIVAMLTRSTLDAAIGTFVLLAVGMTAVSRSIPVNRRSCLGAGFVGGVMGTASSIGGPPVALLFQNKSGAILRSTLGATFLIGTSMSLIGLILASKVEGWHWVLGIALMPAIGLGLLLSRYLHGILDAERIRPSVLLFAGVSGMIVLLRGLL